jgi:hypothetical protein
MSTPKDKQTITIEALENGPFIVKGIKKLILLFWAA